MADVKLYDKSGSEQIYEDVSSVTLDTPDGGTATFFNADDIPKELPEVTTDDDGKVLGVVGGVWQKANYEKVIPKARLIPLPSSDNNGKALGIVSGAWRETKLPRTWDELGGKPFGKTNTIIEEREITLDIEGSAYWCRVYEVGYPTVGDNYKVVWDGAEYACTAKSFKEAVSGSGLSLEVDDMPVIGNLYTLLGEGYLDTGEPFVCVFQSDGHCEFLSRESVGTESKTITVSIVPVVSFKKIPEEYLPESSGGGAGLPDVTEADNGKVLGVVGGKWSVTTPPGCTAVDVEKTVSYDFATQGVPSISVPNEAFGVTMYKVSDELPTLEELQGAKFYSSYIPGEENSDVNVVVDTATAMISTKDVFMSDQYISDWGNYNFAVVYTAGEISFEFMGTTLTITVPETGIYLPYNLGENPPTDWQFSLTYKTKAVASGGASSPPEFDLAAMGLPTLSMEQMDAGISCDASELCAALDKDVVKISFKIDLGGEMTVTGIVNAMVLDGTYSCGFVGMFQGMPLLINFMIDTERIGASITILGTGSI